MAYYLAKPSRARPGMVYRSSPRIIHVHETSTQTAAGLKRSQAHEPDTRPKTSTFRHGGDLAPLYTLIVVRQAFPLPPPPSAAASSLLPGFASLAKTKVPFKSSHEKVPLGQEAIIETSTTKARQPNQTDSKSIT
ncbi:unnamed protein product, partial [Ectocarpus sp. 6 AP-2014]